MTMFEVFAKEYLHNNLRDVREVMLWKLDGLSEYDARRPLTATGTNLLGLVKHLTNVEAGYLGGAFGRPFAEPLAWTAAEREPNADMWATPDESREDIVGQYHRVCAHVDETIRTLPLDATGEVPHWPPDRRHPTLHAVLVHLVAETHRHAGHADIVREQVDGGAGHRPAVSNMARRDTAWWAAHYDRLEQAARQADPRSGRGIRG